MADFVSYLVDARVVRSAAQAGTFDVFPDSELLATTILAEGDWGALTQPHIGTAIPDGANFDIGVVVVARSGGQPRERHRIDRPRIQVDVLASQKAHAALLVQQARYILMSAEGFHYDLASGPDAFLSGVDDELGVIWIFDPISLQPRYTLSVRFTVHADT